MRPAFKGLLSIILAVALGLTGCSAGQAPANDAAADTTAVQVDVAVENFWTVGILTGPSPFELGEPAEIVNPVLTGFDATDIALDIAAHPFMLARDSMFYMFFTGKNEAAHTGGIGSATSRDGLHWTYNRLVIDEPYDLAYPFVFEWQGEVFMTVETHTEPGVRLYKAAQFPDSWEFAGEIITGDIFISPTLFRHGDRWWMYACASGNETLRLFYADELMGPWTEHPASPIVARDLNTARPAGRPLLIDGTLYRIAQDCEPTYGNRVLAFRVLELSTSAYREEMLEKPLAALTGQGWNSAAMHHVDAHQLAPGRWIAVVDALGAPVGK